MVFAAEYLSGRVWYDLNKNGIEDAGEPGVQGARVTVRGTAITTDANGNWTSVDLRSGRSYSATFSNIPTGYVFSPQNQGNDDTVDSDPDPVSGVTDRYTAVSNTTIYNVDAGIYLPTPEIDIKGKGLTIIDGDVTPSINDDTFFGSLDIVTGSVVKTFTIHNSGDGTLNLNGTPIVVISGTNAADFSVTSSPSGQVAAGGGTTTFAITFNPSAAGGRVATISISNNDSNENPYNFSIQGFGTATPEIDIKGNGISIPDEDTTPGTADGTDFSTADIYGGANTHSFNIYNTGSGALTLTGSPRVSITGSHASDFSVSQQPVSGTVAALGGSQSFQITFDPSTTGLRQATVSITSDDPNESPYTFAIRGTGTINPEIDIRGNGLSINSGDMSPSVTDSTSFGLATVGGDALIVQFILYNTGPATLNLTGSWPLVQISGNHAADFSVYAAPSSTVAPGGSTIFKIAFEPITSGTRSAMLTINNNDLNEGAYTFAIQGSGQYATAPLSEIDIQGNLISIPDEDGSPSTSDGTDFGSVSVDGGVVNHTFTIKNTGSEDLVLTATPLVSIAGAHAADFSVSQQPSSPVAPSGTVPFTITFNPSAGGVRTAYVTIENNDANESPYNFTIRGTGLTSPEILVKGNNVEIVSGDNTPVLSDSTYVGDVTASLGVSYVTYTIYNTGSTTLNLTGSPVVSILGQAAAEFAVVSFPSSAISPNSSSSFVVAFDPSQVGPRDAAISITSDDSDESTYLFAIRGNGTGPGSPLVCAPNFFHIFGDNGTVTYLDASTNPYTYTVITVAGYSINGMGYNLEDGLLYGFEMDAVIPGNNIVRIDGLGTITVLSSVTIPYESWRADFDDSGNMYFWNSNGTAISIFDASEGTVTSQNTGGVDWVPIDMAYLDNNGKFYGIQTTTLYIYDPVTNSVSTESITGRLADEYATGTNSAYYGACWTAYDGYLYTTNSQSGRMYKVNVSTFESVYVGQAEANLNKSDGASCPLAEAPLPSTGSIGNIVWIDDDGDGVQDASEFGLPGISVSLYSSDDTFIASTVTDGNGSYQFQNLAPSDYYLIFSGAPAGFSFTLQDQGSNDLLDSDADEVTGRTADFFVNVGLIEEGLDAGYTTTGLGNFVWNDLDHDGTQDLGEVGVPGVTVQLLLASNNSVVATTTTDADGRYAFSGVSPNSYRMSITNLPGGYVVSPQNAGGNDLTDSDISTTTFRTGTYTLTSGMFNSSVDAGIYQNTAPEMNITGNGVDIVDGDTSPSITDHTDFGPVSAASGTLVRTFTVQNTTGADLTLNGSPKVALSGTHASDFSVTLAPSSTITAGNNTTFQITFDPSGLGIRSAIVSISNNDANENPYDFDIQGTGLAPQIALKGNNTNIVSGSITPSFTDSTDFGEADVVTGQPAVTFKVFNLGSSSLSLTGTSPYITISGTNASDFSIIVPPATIIAGGDSSSFVVQFNPSGEGLRTAILSLDNNDTDENPFTFSVQGTGTSFPEIEIQAGTEFISDGDLTPSVADLTDFGSQDIIVDQATHTFTIRNTGSGVLALTGLPIVQVTGTNAGDFVVSPQPVSATVDPSETTTFEVTFNPTTTGVRQATIVIGNDDGDENPFTFAIKGLGTSTLDEEIEVLGNGTVIDAGDTSPSMTDNTDFGTAEVSGVPTHAAFVIRNIGYAVLSLTGPPPYVDITGTHASDFNITGIPSSSVAIDSATTTFEVTFTPAGLGIRTATISIQNDDADENPYTFSIQGTGIYDPLSQSEISVEGNMILVTDGDDTPNTNDGTDMGSVEVVGGFTTTQEFVIHNHSLEDDLVLGSTPTVSFTGTHSSDFSISSYPATLVAPNSSVAFTVVFNPSATGVRTATVVIGNSDQDENPYTFTVIGTGTTAPVISVLGNSTQISNGDISPSTSDSTDFGDVDVALGNRFITYTIQNTGSSSLILSGSLISLSGANSADFSVASYPAATIPMGGSSTFILEFDALVVGTRKATVSISSNDPVTPTFQFGVQGYGTGAGFPLSCAPNFFQVYGSNGTIAYLDASTSPYTYTTLATAGYVIDGIGYNVQDGLIYGFEHDNPNWWSPENMVRIDATGAITVLDAIDHSFASTVADFDDAGNYYFWDATGTDLRVFDASEGTVTGNINPSGAFLAEDMAYRISDGKFYGVRDSTLYIYDPVSNSVSSSIKVRGKLNDDVFAGTNGNDFGSTWTTSDGYIYVANTVSGRMYKINVDTNPATSIFVGQASAVANRDGASCPDAESPLPTTGTIGDLVWLDSNGNGLQDAGEAGLAGVTVSLYEVGNGSPLASIVTAADGAFSFGSLVASQYYLTFTTPPAGFTLSPKGVGTNDAVDSDADPGTFKTDNIDITPGVVNTNVDAGFKATGVGDLVWLDVNEDGIQSAGETGVPGINVEIKIESSGVSAGTTTTDANGYYAFTGLSAIQYRLYFTNLAAGYVFSPQNQGGDDNLDSDINTGTGQSGAFTLSSGVFNNSVDAGVFQQSTPEIDVKGNNVSIPDGSEAPSETDHTDFGTIAAMVDSVVYTFDILNVSGADLTLNGTPRVAISGTNASDFLVSTQPAASITAGNSSSFVIRFLPSGEGLRSAQVTIANTDANENPYTFSIWGFGLASEIQVSGNSNVITSGATTTDLLNLTDFGTQDIATGSEAHIFSILNTGNANLVLTDPSPHITIGGDHPQDFSVTSAPISPVASNNSTPFTLTFDPTAEGLRTAIISIANNDIDENPYTFLVKGLGSATPEIEVAGNNEFIADGDETPTTADATDFGSKDILTDTQSNTFTIVNPGSGTLALTGTPIVVLSGSHAGDFLVSAQPETSAVAAGDSLSFEITFNPTAVGLRTATLSIASDDADENPFNFAIQGTGVASNEIDILGNGLSIVSGDMTPSVLDSTVFDSTIVDSAYSITFTIINRGSASLNLTGVSPYVTLTGDDASDFNISSVPNALIAAGNGTTTFTVTFIPSVEGLRTAIVNIGSDDTDEGAYTFAIRGYGLPTPQPELTLVETVDLDIAAPGDTLTYTVVYSNVGVGLATSVVVDEDIPANVTYLENSAAGVGMVIVFSHDGGTVYNGVQSAPVTHIRFQRIAALPSGESGTLSFRVIVD